MRGDLGRFHTPNAEKVRSLVADSLGLPDLPNSWAWSNVTPGQNRERLHQIMSYRHQVAHGVSPRPEITIRYARPIPEFVRQLAQATDAAVRAHLVETLGLPNPWPE